MNFEVFISYSHEDKIEAELLCKVLDKAGVTYWIDRNIHGSANFLTEITEKIRQCKVVIFIASSSSAKSIFTQKEILFAFKHNKTIVPYKLGNFTFEHNPELDFLFTNIQWIEKLEDVVADVYKLCYNKELFQPISNSTTKRPFYKKYFKLLLVCILAITTIGLIVALNAFHTKSKSKKVVIEKINSEQSIIDEFAKQDDLPISERVNIVDLIKTFINHEADESGDIYINWNIFREYTKDNRLVPLTDGIEREDFNDYFFLCKLAFISKLTYAGDNLDSNIFGKSKIQSVTLYGGFTHTNTLVIDTGENYLSEEISSDWISEELKFSEVYNTNKDASMQVAGINYTMFRKNYYWLMYKQVAHSRGNSYKWVVCTDKVALDDYIQYVENSELYKSWSQTFRNDICPKCGGRGAIYDYNFEGYETCPTCYGTGIANQ